MTIESQRTRRPLFRPFADYYWRGSTVTVEPQHPILCENEDPLTDENAIVLLTET